MQHDFPKPSWQPREAPTLEWTLSRLRGYLPHRRFTVFQHGSCVVWPEGEKLSDEQCREALLAVVSYHPDFKVRPHSAGDRLITFRGGVGGVMSGEFLEAHLPSLRKQALSQGMLPSEVFLHEDDAPPADELDLIAGLYVRAQLYRDVEQGVVVARL